MALFANYRECIQVSEDSFEWYHRTMEIEEDTTVLDLLDFKFQCWACINPHRTSPRDLEGITFSATPGPAS